MHKSHQTRLTGLSNQINEQHANQMAVVREEYETRVKELEDTLKQLQEPNEEAEKLIEDQKAELQAKIEQLEQVSVKDKEGFEKEITELKKASAAQIESLVASHKEELEKLSQSLKVNFGLVNTRNMSFISFFV